MRCPACGFENPAGTRFCGGCGESIGLACPSCGSVNPPEFRFCGSCGGRIGDAPHASERTEERKVVTALFADLVDFTARAESLDPEDVHGLLRPYYARLKRELERFGGTVEKFIGDAVMALFGAPIAHEDDPERAVRAAFAVREAIRALNEEHPELDLHARIGVATGEAVVTLGARPSEGQGMAAGDVVNTAARLQAAAPIDGILVGDSTHRTTHGAIEYEAVDPVRVKGKTDAVRAWRAVAPRSRFGIDVAQRGRSPLVGRSVELALLRDTFERARRGRCSQLVTLVGTPGIGKSRVVAELFLALETDPDGELIYWRQGRSLPYGEAVTFWALGEMVKAQAGMLEGDPAETAEAKLREAVQELVPDAAEARWVETHLRPLVGLSGEAEAHDDRRTEAFAAWRTFLEALAERRPLVLVFEDLHWADDGLLAFVDHLVEWTSDVPVLVIATARPELLERRPDWGGGKRNAVTVSVPPLSDEEVERLVAALLADEAPGARTEALVARAGGNPLYAEQYARMLAERRTVRADGDWRPGEGVELPLPESLHGIIAARLDTLAPEEKLLLQDAAVVGKVFPVDALCAVGTLAGSSVAAGLHALERKEFVRRERGSSFAGDAAYAFAHVLVRDVAYGQIPRARRAEKHRLAAEWIERLTVDRREDHADMLAHHYLSALELAEAVGRPVPELGDRARVALRDAGDRASALNAFGAATRHYARALELWPADDPERPHLLFRLGKARFHCESAGADLLEEAAAVLVEAGDRETAAEAEVLLGDLLWVQGQWDPAFERFDRSVDLLADAPDSRSKAYVLSNRARFRMLAGHAEEAVRVGFEALQLAEELGLDDLRAHALTNIGVARTMMGDRGGVADLERSVAISAETNSPESVRGFLNLGSTYAELGDLRKAFDVHAAGRRMAERFADAGGMRWFAAERVFERYWRGQWEDAARLADDLIDESAGDGRHYSEYSSRIVRGWIRLARGELEPALDDAAHALDFARQAADAQALHPALAFRARTLLAAGRTDDARALADELVRTWTGGGPLVVSFWVADLAPVLLGAGSPRELLGAAAATPIRTRWLDAAAAFAAGEFERAATLYSEIGTLPDEAFARLRAAERLVEAGDRDDADRELARAAAFYRSVGATAYLREVESLLASV